MTAHEEDTPWLNGQERDAWLAVSAALMTKLPAALDAQLQRDAGIGFFDYKVMAALSEQSDSTLQMSDVASGTASSLSRLSHTATRLEALGFVRRERCAGAGRRTNLILTATGREKVEQSAAEHVKTVRRLLIDATTPELQIALTNLGVDILRRIDPDDRTLDMMRNPH